MTFSPSCRERTSKYDEPARESTLPPSFFQGPRRPREPAEAVPRLGNHARRDGDASRRSRRPRPSRPPQPREPAKQSPRPLAPRNRRGPHCQAIVNRRNPELGPSSKRQSRQPSDNQTFEFPVAKRHAHEILFMDQGAATATAQGAPDRCTAGRTTARSNHVAQRHRCPPCPGRVWPPRERLWASRQNLCWAFAYNTLGVPLAALGLSVTVVARSGFLARLDLDSGTVGPPSG